MRFSICDFGLLIIALLWAGGCGSHVTPATMAADHPAQQHSIEGSYPVLYQRTGGIAGTDDRVVIWPDGMATVRGKLLGDGNLRINEADLAKLHSLMTDFSKLQNEYPDGVADAYEITITYGAKSVTASDLSPQLPEEFRKIYTAIEALAAQVLTTAPAPD